MIRNISLFAVLALAVSASSCAVVRRDRCYVSTPRYFAMRAIFESTGSYQRVAQAMDDEGWAHCEINHFRYRLRKDLGLDDPEFDYLFTEYEPSRKTLDFNPGRVEDVVGEDEAAGK